ncbi:OB-fold protein [Maribacter sp. CXY002]|uniref:OB-fold protein n=1 Tax=Maribacter luteocoastalis TaxID=3407671 RepID=UPI003B66CD9F
MLNRKIGIGIGMALIVMGLIGFSFWPNKERTLTLNTPVDHDLTFTRFQTMLLSPEEGSKSDIRSNQIIQVSGYVKEVNLLNERITLILKGEYDTSPYMICDFQANQEHIINELKKNDYVRVKGVFKGILKDAIFLNCIITYTSSHE